MGKTYKLLILSCLISAFAILAISFFIGPKDGDTSTFWYRVAWTEILNIIFWFGTSNWFITDSSKSAITPAISVFTSILCFISFGLMLIEHKFTDIDFMHNYHIAMQIGLFAFYILLVIGFNLAGHYGNYEMMIPADAAKSPSELSDYLFSIEKTLYNNPDQNVVNLATRIKNFREKIKYSFQDTAKTRMNSDYQELSSSTLNFCSSLEENLSDKKISAEKINYFETESSNLINKIERIAAFLKRN
jgi:hypothetical protein